MPETYDAIVLGVGGVGSAALLHLAQRGLRVLGLEQFTPPHDRGSSHGHTRAIRQAYFEHPSYVPLLRRAYSLWDALDMQTGEQLFRRVGLVQVGNPEGELIRGVMQSSREHALPITRYDPGVAARHFPQFRFPNDRVALWEENAGFLFVERCVQAHTELAVQWGATLRAQERVVQWNIQNKTVQVVSERHNYEAGSLVICGGPWSQQLLPQLGVRLRVIRKHVFWLNRFSSMYDVDHGCPVFFFETPEGFFYGFPAIAPYGVKVAEHSGGQEVVNDVDLQVASPDADRDEESLRQRTEDWQRVARFVETYMPGVWPECTAHSRCWYTMSPDSHFIVDLLPTSVPVAFAAGLSGHGFKFASVLGEVLADLVLRGETAHPIDFLRANRFPATACARLDRS